MRVVGVENANGVRLSLGLCKGSCCDCGFYGFCGGEWLCIKGKQVRILEHVCGSKEELEVDGMRRQGDGQVTKNRSVHPDIILDICSRDSV